MKVIKSKTDQKTIENDLGIQIQKDSVYALIENGFPPINDCINIVFESYNKQEVRLLLSKAGYFKKSNNHILGKKGEELELIHLKDIRYFEGINNDTYIHTKGNEYSTKLKLYELEEMYKSKLFIRISKSYIVSLHHISKIKPTFNGKLTLELNNGIQLEVTRHYIKEFRYILGM